MLSPDPDMGLDPTSQPPLWRGTFSLPLTKPPIHSRSYAELCRMASLPSASPSGRSPTLHPPGSRRRRDDPREPHASFQGDVLWSSALSRRLALSSTEKTWCMNFTSMTTGLYEMWWKLPATLSREEEQRRGRHLASNLLGKKKKKS